VPREAQAHRELWATEPEVVHTQSGPLIEGRDDLSRAVYGILGIPLDVIEIGALLDRIDLAVVDQTPFLLSTPNVNFLMMGRADPEFRESLLLSDLCPVDGMPLVWIARLLGVPVRCRLSGADIFDALRARQDRDQKLKVFLFGGSGSVADSVAMSINAQPGGLLCVGALNPGFGSVTELSSAATLNEINTTCADLLTVFLSARKAQGWLLQNHHRIKAPFRAQFGATINVQAGVVKRAPLMVQRIGFEWLWRVKEEPYLWRRYLKDGLSLLRVCATQVLPLSIGRVWRSLTGRNLREGLGITQGSASETSLTLKLSGAAIERHIDAAIMCFRNALAAQKAIVIDLSQTSAIDQRFFGLLLMLRKQLVQRGDRLTFSGATRHTRTLFRMNGFEFLLDPKT
jgi:N-acetylglucosaminyldiphosphoundecaprenol N-acetyl-beta-D-mannosaminyltransferase